MLQERVGVMSDRAWILLPSGKQLDLLAPDQWAWTDDDLAIGLSRTCRWAGYSAWDLPLSVAQHSLAVLALRRGQSAERPLPIAEARRELLRDATEALMGGWGSRHRTGRTARFVATNREHGLPGREGATLPRGSGRTCRPFRARLVRDPLNASSGDASDLGYRRRGGVRRPARW